MKALLAFALSLAVSDVAAHAADVTLIVSGVPNAPEYVACALFSSAAGFPGETDRARSLKAPARPGQTLCVFRDLPPGQYAAAVSLLREGQAQIDKDFLGRPAQAWGVSQNIRHAFKAPGFDEASFLVPAKGETRIAIELAR